MVNYFEAQLSKDKLSYWQLQLCLYIVTTVVYTMTSTLITLILLVGIVMANGSSIKNYCDVAVKHYYFSINKNSSGVYNIIDFCQQGTTVQGYCDTLTDGGGWLVVLHR